MRCTKSSVRRRDTLHDVNQRPANPATSATQEQVGQGAVTWRQRLRSWRNSLGLSLSQRLRASRGEFRERPCGRLVRVDARIDGRIQALQRRYAMRFESTLNARTSLNNYAYLELLDRAFDAAGETAPRPGRLTDVGCASFWYAAALHAFFRPGELAGFEIEGYRRFWNGHTRADYARGYAGALPGGRFVAADYGSVDAPADLISCWYPFLTAAPLLAWGLPLKLLKPVELFESIGRNLVPGGAVLLVNHGQREAALAAGHAERVGLHRQWIWAEADPLVPRLEPPVASYWRR